MIFQIILIIGYLSTSTLGQFTGCDYFQTMKAGVSYDIFSKNYPSYYPKGTNCRWQAQAPNGYVISLNCPDISIPQTASCVNDRLEISFEGRSDLVGAQKYCGTGTLAYSTTGNKIAMALRSPTSSYGGRFKCSIIAKTATAVTPPPPATCDCGRRKTNRIVGGVETGINEYTMMAALIDSKTSSVKCGSTIIAQQYALTAAHCVQGTSAAYLGLLVGDHDYTTSTDTSYSALYKLSSYTMHSGFSSSSAGQFVNDIAVVRTTTNIVFNVAVGPACLPFKFTQTSFVNVQLIATGWGSTTYSGPVSNRLRKVSLNVISNSQCSSTYPKIQTTQFCTYSSQKDTCQYDSGGPLLYTDGYGVVYEIGVSSFGIGCATAYPAVSTNVASYLGWIQQVTPGATYCNK